MPTVFLVRHGRSTANKDGVLAGRIAGVQLDDVGQAQAAHAGARLSGIALGAIVTSPLERTKQTAAAIVTAVGRTPRATVDRSFIECDYGSWSGQPLKKLSKQALWSTIQDRPSVVTFPDGENMSAMAARANSAVRAWDQRMLEDHDGKAWVAVTHGDIIKAIVADALGLHLDGFQRINVDPGSISVVTFHAGRPFVVAVNTIDGDLSRYAPTPGQSKKRTGTSSKPTVGGSTGV